MRALEAGKYVGMVVWGRGLYTVPIGELRSIGAQMTMSDGRIVYGVDPLHFWGYAVPASTDRDKAT